MAAPITVAALIKNERGRFLTKALEAWGTFANEIVVLDDASSDGSKEECARLGARVFDGDLTSAAWGAETPARRKLFDIAWTHTPVDGYIFVLDADMTPAKDPRPLTETGAGGIFFRLFDLWEPTKFRSDDFWRGHLFPRLWMIRRLPGSSDSFEWGTRGIHSGHFPASLECDSFAWAPEDFSLLHYAYVDEALREEKYVRYASVASDLTSFERAHARSILDPEPSLVRLPFDPELSLL